MTVVCYKLSQALHCPDCSCYVRCGIFSRGKIILAPSICYFWFGKCVNLYPNLGKKGQNNIYIYTK